MVARFDAAPASGWPHRLELGAYHNSEHSPLEIARQGLGADGPAGALELWARDWPLSQRDLSALELLLQQRNLQLQKLISQNPSTLVAATARGWPVEAETTGAPSPQPLGNRPLQVQRGTLRAGEHLEVEGAVLVLGDVNPGARVSASGDVLVWGRLRGIAHAGCRGNSAARIVALQLRPLQLRIADAVARGPEDLPPEGLTEQAELLAGEIQISPAQLGRALNAG
ncbi:MAG: septum site-determining protein MinC [Synechococcus lacustris]|jgi:septum site-determining protein MinC